MIALSFLYRIGMFLLSAAIVIVGAWLVYFLLSKMFMWSMDRISESNAEVFVWLRNRLLIKAIIRRISRKKARKAPQQ